MTDDAKTPDPERLPDEAPPLVETENESDDQPSDAPEVEPSSDEDEDEVTAP